GARGTPTGEPAQCKAQLEALAERYKTSDLLLFMMYPDLEQRLRGYGFASGPSQHVSLTKQVAPKPFRRK
ncbi:MAG: hypothetical protein P8Y45_10110, partial [Exilibacterium sp.]